MTSVSLLCTWFLVTTVMHLSSSDAVIPKSIAATSALGNRGLFRMPGVFTSPVVNSKFTMVKMPDTVHRIVTIQHPPYIFINGSDEFENKTYSGFIVDLIDLLSKMLGFRYEFYESPDGRFGAATVLPQGNITWNGMMGELMKNESIDGAFMIAAPLTMTRMREQSVDFIHPFQHLGLTVLMKKPHVGDDGDHFSWPFSFNIFTPLHPVVWMFTVMALFVVGIILYFMNLYNPYDYGSRLDRGLATEEEAESFGLSGAFWFVFTTMQWQGYDRAPRSLASKMLGCFWMAFVTLTLVTYIGSLVTHLFWASTIHGKDPTLSPINSLEDLVMQSEYKYGTVRGGSTFAYLTKVGKGPEFEMITKYLNENQDFSYDSVEAGVAKVRSSTSNDKYAFIMESLSAKYYVNQYPCDLMTTKESFAMRSYGLAVREDSLYREFLHNAVMELRENGEIERLEEEWWVNKGDCWNVTMLEKIMSTNSQMSVNKPKRIDLSMFWGPLVMIAVGVILSVIVGLAEIFYFKYRGRYQNSNRPRGQKLDEDPNDMLT